MKNTFLLFAILAALFQPLSADDNYWQQFVHYTMDVALDVDAHTVGGSSIITYTNNSPDVIENMYLHLLPNAFQEGSVKHREYLQKFGRLSRAAKFIEGMDSYFSIVEVSDFTIRNDEALLADTFKIDDTILSASLSTPLHPGESLTMEFDWVHHVGEQVERAGRVGDQYNFAQWYPKVVVYDENGWHNFPFHAEGEFYGEFGTFDVSIDVPAWYTVGATGVVTAGDPGWNDVAVDTSIAFKDWLKSFQENKTDIDSTARRTVSFYAEDVHDFAWITSPTFLYEHGSWNGIDVHVLFNEKNGSKWTKKVTARSERGLEWLSSHYGMYPYPQVTTTDRLKGGGMEYPMLVMNGSESESLILHEIGHIWFYGILGNDEVAESWLDEGFTTFQTGQYMMDRYGPHGFDLKESKRYNDMEKKVGKFTRYLDRAQWSTIRFQTSGKDEPISRKSYMFNNGGSYRYNAYTKPGLMLAELKYVLGDSIFFASMQEYFDRWNLKHVNEERFIASVEDIAGEKLDWFFNPWLHNTRILDYGIESWSKAKQADGSWKVDLDIRKHGRREMPQLVEVAFTDGSVERIWWKNHEWRKEDTFSFNVAKEPESAVLDPDVMTMDVDRRNNHSGRLPREWQFDWIETSYNPRGSYYGRWTPTLYYHELDGYTPGFRVNRKYSYWETLKAEIQYATKSGNVYWSLNSYRKPVHSFAGFSSSLHAYDLGGVSGYGLEIKKHLNEAFADFLTNNASLGFYVTNAKDKSRTNLFDIGQIAVLFSRYQFLIQQYIRMYFEIATTPGSVSDWSFSRINAVVKVDVPIGKLGIRNRLIIGHIESEFGVPAQERYTIEGAGSGDVYSKPFLRDASSFYGNTEMRKHYHLAGDANLRGYFDQGLSGVESLIANSIELYYKPGFDALNLELAAFVDDGWVWGSKYKQNDEGFKGDYLLDAGIGLRLKTSFLGKQFYIRVDTPLIVKDVSKAAKGYQFVTDKWLFSFTAGL
ncbi:MAG: M1 family aminopeptidase [Candidatus Marinimicrobia bacterium]|nr:M1 family aminopeptidase [Candidatus Neomarinimicrobiota bacterium]MDP6789384.1 M1 family aminopeptidase [Candidatus Neomarinimicrobiota bacterium]